MSDDARVRPKPVSGLAVAGMWFVGAICVLLAVVGTGKVVHDDLVDGANLRCLASANQASGPEQAPNAALLERCHLTYADAELRSSQTWMGGTIEDHADGYLKYLACHWVALIFWLGLAKAAKFSLRTLPELWTPRPTQAAAG